MVQNIEAIATRNATISHNRTSLLPSDRKNIDHIYFQYNGLATILFETSSNKNNELWSSNLINKEVCKKLQYLEEMCIRENEY